MNINNKEKQAVSGNWGHPSQFEKRLTKIKTPPDVDSVKYKKSRRDKKGEKKLYICPRLLCPFCGTELPEDKVATEKRRSEWGIKVLGKIPVQRCPTCDSYVVLDCCPACKNNTWFNPKTLVYKHQWFGCGFEGQRKV